MLERFFQVQEFPPPVSFIAIFGCCPCVSLKVFLAGAGSSGRPRLIPPINCGSWRDDSLICSQRSCCLGGVGEIGHAGTPAAGQLVGSDRRHRRCPCESPGGGRATSKQKSIRKRSRKRIRTGVCGRRPLVPPPSLLLVVSRDGGGIRASQTLFIHFVQRPLLPLPPLPPLDLFTFSSVPPST